MSRCAKIRMRAKTASQYRIDLTATDRPEEALLTLSALTTGVIIDHIEVE